jgi:hypothetical protein
MSRAEQIDKAISKVYYNLESGFGSQAETYRKTVAEDPRVTRADVKRFFEKQEILQRNKPKGYNSYVPKFPRQQIQLDLAEFGTEAEFRYMLIGVDIFTKQIAAVPLETKKAENVGRAFQEILSKLKVPSEILTDPGGEFQGPFKKFVDSWQIDHIFSRTGGRFVERAIRTVKEGVFKRLEALGLPRSDWWKVVNFVVDKYNRTPQSTTEERPNDVASLNILDDFDNAEIKDIRRSMGEKAQSKRRYPRISVGSRVKLIRKPGKKSEYKGQWADFLDTVHTVERVALKGNNTVYYITGREEPYMRYELLYLPDVRASPLKAGRRLRGKQRVQVPDTFERPFFPQS